MRVRIYPYADPARGAERGGWSGEGRVVVGLAAAANAKRPAPRGTGLARSRGGARGLLEEVQEVLEHHVLRDVVASTSDLDQLDFVTGLGKRGLERSRELEGDGRVGVPVDEPHPQLGVQPHGAPERLPEVRIVLEQEVMAVLAPPVPTKAS